MDQPAKPFTSDGGDTRRWIGRLIIAVLLGEAIWGLIVSFMNHVFVPWLGDVMGQSSGLPTSFTQRPYNYPELFVSVFEFCIAGLVAAVINYFLQRPAARRVKTVKSTSPPGPDTSDFSSTAITGTDRDGSAAIWNRSGRIASVRPSAGCKNVPGDSVHSCPGCLRRAGCAIVAAPEPKPAVIAPVVPATPQPVAAKPAPPAPKAEPAKPKKPKNVYYNIVGEPMPSDED